MLLFYICVIFISLVVSIFFYFYTWTGIRARKLIYKIPGYFELQSWTIAYIAATIPFEDLIDLLDQAFGQFNSICALWFLGVPHVIIKSPEDIEALLKSVKHIKKGKEYYTLTPWLGEGLLTSTGYKWHANRKMLTPAFHFRILESCFPIFNRNVSVMIKLLQEQCKSGETLEVEEYITMCSLDIISEAAMGVHLDAQMHNHSTLDYVHAVRRMSELVILRGKAVHLEKDWIYNLTANGKEQKKILRILHSFTESVIKESKEKRRMEKYTEDIAHQPATFVDYLLEMSEKEPGLFTDVEIRQEVDTFMFEGHDTTTSSISWTLLLLGHDQGIQERAYNEMAAIFRGSDRPVTKQDLGKMTYLEAVIKESLRLYPPVSFMSRKLEYDLELEKYTVPGGTNVLFMPYFIHRQKSLFQDPERFDPDRFLSAENLNRHPFSYIPFSGGPRNCIGQRFAMMEMKVVLSHILRNFRMESETQREGLKVLFSPVLRTLNGTCIKFYPRM